MSHTASLFSHFVSTRGTFRWLSPLVIVSSAAAWVAVGFDIAEIRRSTRQVMGLRHRHERAAHTVVGEVVLQHPDDAARGHGHRLRHVALPLPREPARLRHAPSPLSAQLGHLRIPDPGGQPGAAVSGDPRGLAGQRPQHDRSRRLEDGEAAAARSRRGGAPSSPSSCLKILAWWMTWSAAYDLTRLRIADGVRAAGRRPGGAERDPRLLRHRSHHRGAAASKWERLSPPPGA